MSADGTLAWAALAATRGLGRKGLRDLAMALDDQRRCAAELLGTSPDALTGLGLRPDIAAAAAESLSAPPVLEMLREGVIVITPDDEKYPRRFLRSGAALPVIMLAEGDPALLSTPTLGISGSRAAHEDATDLAAAIARLAARNGVTVVTGGAVGIDSSAHRSVLDAGGSAVVVLAEGIGNRSLVGEDSVLVLSEFPPGTPWLPRHAMQRNETIAAVSDEVVVVACGARGGSWSQAELCLKKGVPLFVPNLNPEVAPGNQLLVGGSQGKATGRHAISFEPDDPEAPLRHLATVRDALRRAPGTAEQLTLLG